MAELKDSGARREFSSGAVRDITEGKGRCDLLPLGVVAEILNDSMFLDIERYIRDGNTKHLMSAIQAFSMEWFDGELTAYLEVSKQYEDGARKYNDRNWESGIPVHCFIDSGVRHYLKFLRGDTDEPHDRAFIWNMLGAIWTHENKPELIDLPFSVADIPTTDKPVEPWGEEDNKRQNRLLCALTPCRACAIPGLTNGRGDVSCDLWCQANPAKGRKIMDEMEGMK